MNPHNNYRCKTCGEIIRGYPEKKRKYYKMHFKLFNHVLKAHHMNLWDDYCQNDERNIQEYFMEMNEQRRCFNCKCFIPEDSKRDFCNGCITYKNLPDKGGDNQ